MDLFRTQQVKEKVLNIYIVDLMYPGALFFSCEYPHTPTSLTSHSNSSVRINNSLNSKNDGYNNNVLLHPLKE